MSRAFIELAIADRVYDAEKRACAALGHDAIDRATYSLGAFCGVLQIALAPDRPAVWPRGGEPRDAK